MPTALVTGATGVLGREIVSALAADDATWTTIYALSRSQTIKAGGGVQNMHLDLLSTAQEMAKSLADVSVDYIFFAAYLAKDSEDEATKANGQMLDNFLEAMHISGASKATKRVVLVTGAKQYGVHLGVPKLPMEESDRWLQDKDRPPNFYYRQQNILAQRSRWEGWDWVVTYPNDVIGVAKGNFMNLTTALGIYCAVTKELGQELMWPGSPDFYTRFDSFTSSRLHARFVLWAALNRSSSVSKQAFNVVNGDVESWQNMWPRLAAKFGLRVPETMFTADEERGELDTAAGSSSVALADHPPLREFAAERGLLGSRRLAPSRVERKVDLERWAAQADVREAWERLVKRHGLEREALDGATWGFLNFVLGRNFDLVISVNKSRRAGWSGHEDTFESLSTALNELVAEKVVPPFTLSRNSGGAFARQVSSFSSLGVIRARDQA